MMKTLCVLVAAFLLISYRVTGASPHDRFADAEPVRQADDSKPIPAPQAADFSKNFYIVDVVYRRPATAGLKLVPKHVARDINSMDEVPGSSWFTPRLGEHAISGRSEERRVGKEWCTRL